MADVLIVEDSPTASYVLRHLLEDLGVSVEVATHGIEAFSLAKSNRPKLILMDLMMPVMDGYRATRVFKMDPELQEIPIVIHSSKSDVADKTWSKKQGASGFLPKPATRKTLSSLLKHFLPEESNA